jgi:nucleoside-diphosphate-sugar epimerase
MNKKKYNCFVSGGAGLIGLEICNKLIAKGHNVAIYDLGEQIERNKSYINPKVKIFYGSILDAHSLKKAIQKCDLVFHHAAMLGVKYTEDNKLDCLEINSTGTKNILEACIANKVKKIIFASSSEVYGEPKTNPITEKFDTKGKTIYGISKLMGEEYCKSYNQKYKLNYTILRYFNTYGAYQQKKFVIQNFIYDSINHKQITINGNGSQKRSYMYVSDAAEATITAAFSKKTNKKIFNIGNGKNPVTLKKLSETVKKVLKKQNIITVYKKNFKKTDRTIDREIFYRYCDSSKFQKLTKWKPKITLEEGIKKILMYFDERRN